VDLHITAQWKKHRPNDGDKEWSVKKGRVNKGRMEKNRGYLYFGITPNTQLLDWQNSEKLNRTNKINTK